MEVIDRYLLHVTLAFTVVICLVMVIVNFVTSRGEFVVVAAVPHTPVVLDVQFELRRGALTIAVVAQLEGGHAGSSVRPDFAQSHAGRSEPQLYLGLGWPQALLVNERPVEENRKAFNSLSLDGEQMLHQLTEEGARRVARP